MQKKIKLSNENISVQLFVLKEYLIYISYLGRREMHILCVTKWPSPVWLCQPRLASPRPLISLFFNRILVKIWSKYDRNSDVDRGCIRVEFWLKFNSILIVNARKYDGPNFIWFWLESNYDRITLIPQNSEIIL